jgi:tRNA nucleotidyltransferase (CCA-adding enzyme)
VVGAHPEQLLAQGFQPVGKDFPVFLHPESKEEYALARTERKTGKGYAGFDCYASPDVTLEQDLARRDLTINAIARASDGQLIDPYGGAQDIANKQLRHVSEAFIEDPLRVLRVARFYARYYHLGFSIADETLALMQQISASGELAHLSKERIWRETDKALGEKNPERYFYALQQCGALPALIEQMPALSKTQLTRLQQGAICLTSSAARFALLAFEWPDTLCQHICESLKTPNEVAQLAGLVSRFGRQCCSDTLTPQQQLQLLAQLDAYRRPERFHDFLACCHIYRPAKGVQQLTDALPICQQIDAKALAAQGLQGKAIGEALQQQRLQALIDKDNP